MLKKYPKNNANKEEHKTFMKLNNISSLVSETRMLFSQNSVIDFIKVTIFESVSDIIFVLLPSMYLSIMIYLYLSIYFYISSFFNFSIF